MTYKKLQDILKVFLLGDNPPPKDSDLLIATLEVAYIELANDCTALKLLTGNRDDEIIRTGTGSSFVRMPRLPTVDTDELDIDNELVPAVARIMAGYIAKELKNKSYHKSEADKIIRQYESKVRAYMLKRANDGKYTTVVPTTDNGVL